MNTTIPEGFPFSKEELAKIIEAIGDDGHSIYNVEGMAKHLEIDIQKLLPFCANYKSSKTDFKQAITDGKGNPVAEMSGIYGLTMLERIGTDLGLEWEDKMGRGFRARVVTKAIQDFLQKVG